MVTYKQVIEVKNTHRETITIEILDQLPRSSEERVKVSLTILYTIDHMLCMKMVTKLEPSFYNMTKQYFCIFEPRGDQR